MTLDERAARIKQQFKNKDKAKKKKHGGQFSALKGDGEPSKKLNI